MHKIGHKLLEDYISPKNNAQQGVDIQWMLMKLMNKGVSEHEISILIWFFALLCKKTISAHAICELSFHGLSGAPERLKNTDNN